MNFKDSIINRESEFYDRYAETVIINRLEPLRAFPLCSGEYAYVLKLLGDISGQTVLDIGCGHGDSTAYFSLKGAKVIGIDVSHKCLVLARNLAQKWRVEEQTDFIGMDIRNMGLSSEFFNIIYGDGVLHHLDMRSALGEINRVLKRGGIAIFIEPQRGNIFMRIYRLFAADVRSLDEKPLTAKDLIFLRKIFKNVDITSFQLLSLIIFALYFIKLRLLKRIWPYWFDDVTHGKVLPKMYRFLQKLDMVILNNVPFLRKYTWNLVICYTKK